MKKMIIGLTTLLVASVGVYGLTAAFYTGSTSEVTEAQQVTITSSSVEPDCCDDKSSSETVATKEDGCDIAKTETVASKGACPFTGSSASIQTVATSSSEGESGCSMSKTVAAKAGCDGSKDCDMQSEKVASKMECDGKKDCNRRG